MADASYWLHLGSNAVVLLGHHCHLALQGAIVHKAQGDLHPAAGFLDPGQLGMMHPSVPCCAHQPVHLLAGVVAALDASQDVFGFLEQHQLLSICWSEDDHTAEDLWTSNELFGWYMMMMILVMAMMLTKQSITWKTCL